MDIAMDSVLQTVGMGVGSDAVPVELEAQVTEAVAFQGVVFPALVGLASLSALGLAWWLQKKVGLGPGKEICPLKDFRFNDQLVWVFIVGILALVASSGGLERLGTNTVVFMGALYALRGVGVVLFMTGGVSVLGALLFIVGFVLLAPFVVFGAVFIGLGDTWFDLRSRGASPQPGV
jgi:hypothetical protein